MAARKPKAADTRARGASKRSKLPGKEMLEWMYRTMARIRRFEEAADRAFQAARMRGALHFYIGEEASGTGVCAALTDADYITSTHRGHGHCIAKGGRLDLMMAELFGKATGYCGGKGGSMHIADLDLGNLGANGIVGGGLPIATGAALGSKLRGEDKVTVCFFGDGAAPNGTFHESVNFGALHDLPIVYVCENNQWGMGTHVSNTNAGNGIASRGASYGIPGIVVDGNDIFDVFAKTTIAVKRARAGKGPSLLVCETYRHRGHTVHDQAAYRDQKDVDKWMARDPIERFRKAVIAAKAMSKKKLDAIDAEVLQEVEAAVEFAEASPFPQLETLLQGVYTDA